MYCLNGHEFAVGKESPKFCPLCGVSLTNHCIHGHEMPGGVAVCAVCGAAATEVRAANGPASPGPGLAAGSTSKLKGTALPHIAPPPPPTVVRTDEPAAAHRSKPGMVIGLVAAAVVLLVGGVAVGQAVSHRSAPPPSSTRATATSSDQSTPQTQPAPTRATSKTSITKTTTTLASGLAPVDTSAVSSNPEAAQIALTFETYFGGIDNQNWNLAYSAYSQQYQSQVPESQFESADGSSTDTDAAITSISPGPLGSTIADVSFQSAQAADAGPVPGETCTDWTLAYTLVPQTSGDLTLLIDSATVIGPGHVGCPGQP